MELVVLILNFFSGLVLSRIVTNSVKIYLSRKFSLPSNVITVFSINNKFSARDLPEVIVLSRVLFLSNRIAYGISVVLFGLYISAPEFWYVLLFATPGVNILVVVGFLWGQSLHRPLFERLIKV